MSAVKQELNKRFNISRSELASFCQRHHIKSLALFGSVLRDDFRPDSDIDVLVEFQPGRTPGFFTIVELEDELSVLFDNRKVDLRTPQDLSHHFRERVIKEAKVLCR
ncbi:MAG: nucleotidyltransferase family protein [Dehalococcoidales bacterium]|nr:nucleotidyltransferase family protein [Dehalococcoidales bacterium]